MRNYDKRVYDLAVRYLGELGLVSFSDAEELATKIQQVVDRYLDEKIAYEKAKLRN